MEEVRNLAQPSQPYLLTMDQAVELGVINSRDYQDQRDNLYLTALPVTLERFAFAAQFEALGSIFREWLGREVTGGPANDWRFQTTTGFTKLFSTGALLLFQFANTTVINITHPFGQEAVTSQSTITLDLIQPLLRGGGRAVTLEPLTQAERNLLYEIRDFAHFRKGFYAYITAGVNLPTGSIVTPSALARAILPTSVASTTVGVSGTTIAPVVSPGAGAPSNPIFPPIPPSAGFLPTLVFRAQIDVDRGNVTTLERFLKLFTALKEGGDVSELQVENVEQALLGGQTQVLSDELSYGNFLDQLKLQLGVPTSLPLELDSSMLRPITHQFDRFERVLSEYDAVQAAAAALAAEPVARLRPRLHELATSAALVRGTPFRTAFPGRWAAWERLSDKEVAQRLAQERAERRKVLDQRAELESADKPVPASLQQRQDQLDADIDLGLFEQALRDYEAQPWRALPDAEARRRAQASYFRLVINAFTVVIGAARNERLLQIRESWPDLPPSCVSGLDLIQADQDRAMTMVAQTALVNRLDLMNDRAQLMDAWRRIAVAANALLGTLNVQYNLNSFTPPGQAKPFAFGDGRNTNQIIFNWQLPLVRIVERNNYRSSLIAYQRQRRALMAEEDFVLDAVRTDLRQLRLAAEQYRIQKRAVELAYAQVENSLDTFRAPPTPLTQAGGNMQATAAALTTQLLGAQSALRTAQTQMLTFFLNYLTYRVQLYTDLELLPLDNRGVWTDDVATCQCPPEHPARRAAEGSGGRPEGAGSERQGEQRPEQLPEPVPAPPGPALDAGR